VWYQAHAEKSLERLEVNAETAEAISSSRVDAPMEINIKTPDKKAAVRLVKILKGALADRRGRQKHRMADEVKARQPIHPIGRSAKKPRVRSKTLQKGPLFEQFEERLMTRFIDVYDQEKQHQEKIAGHEAELRTLCTETGAPKRELLQPRIEQLRTSIETSRAALQTLQIQIQEAYQFECRLVARFNDVCDQAKQYIEKLAGHEAELRTLCTETGAPKRECLQPRIEQLRTSIGTSRAALQTLEIQAQEIIAEWDEFHDFSEHMLAAKPKEE